MEDYSNRDQFGEQQELGHPGDIVPIDAGVMADGNLAEFPGDAAFAAPVVAQAVAPAAVTAALPAGISLAMFLRAKWWIMSVFLLVAGAAVPLVWMFVTPEYRARASIRISPVVSRIVFATEDNGIVPLYQSFVNTQVSVILGSVVLKRVLDREDIRQSAWYSEPAKVFMGTKMSKLERLRGSLTVTPRRSTELIDVSIVTNDSTDAKLIVDAVVDSYKTYTDETLRQNDIRRLETLIRERDTLQKEVDGLIATKYRLTKILGTADPETYRAQLSALLSELRAEKEALQRKRSIEEWAETKTASLESDGETVADATPDEDVPTMDPVQQARMKRYSRDAEWRGLNMSVEASKSELSVSMDRYGELHPRIRQLTAGVELAERLRHEREYQLDEDWMATQMSGLATSGGTMAMLGDDTTDPGVGRYMIPGVSNAEVLDQQIELLANDIDRKNSDLTDAGEIAKQVAHYDEEIRYKRELYELVRQRLTAFEMEAKAPARIMIADYAVKPWGPYRDRRIILSVLATMGAIAMGLGVGFLRGTVDPRIHGEADINTPIHVPFLGKLPLLPSGPCLDENSDPVVTESIRMVRTALLKRLGSSGSQVVLVTSSASCAGKTSVAILLSRSLAQLGKKTLLVEADLRRPSIADRMNFVADTGLAGVLSGTIDEEEVVVSTRIANLDVLPAGLRPPQFNFELLANGTFAACMKRWRESYDCVVLDSPPVFPVADARILATQVDGTIMVLRAAHCRRNDVFQAYTDLLAGGGKVVGTVFIGSTTETSYGDYADGRQYLETV